MLFALGYGMKIFTNVLVFVLVLLLGAVSYGQDCPNGQCSVQSRPLMRSVVEAPVRVIQSTGNVVRSVAAAPRRVFAQQPIRRLFSRLRCR
jgi:hypothetical protein